VVVPLRLPVARRPLAAPHVAAAQALSPRRVEPRHAAALRARGLPALEASCTAVWLHGRAAEIAGPQMIADDLAEAVPRAIADL